MNYHPCQKCGACCAFYRVSFYWREAEPLDTTNPVPEGFWKESSDNQRCLIGTDQKHKPKCTALGGKIGEFVYCTIYENRPTPCRNFMASYENGYHNPRCDEARAKHGLRPLCKSDWTEIQLPLNPSVDP